MITKLSFPQWEDYVDGGTQTSALDFSGSQCHEMWAKLWWLRICPQTSTGLCFGVQVACLQEILLESLFGFDSGFSAHLDEF